MESNQTPAISSRILTTTLVVMVACAVLATSLVAIIFYSDRKNNEVAALKTEIDALKQRQELTQRNIVTLTVNVATLMMDIETLRQEQAIVHSGIEDLASEMESLKSARLEDDSSAESTSANLSETEGEAEGPSTSSPKEVKLNVPRYKQAHNLTCESSTASMVANFYGVPLSEEQINRALPRNENPYLGFRGRLDGAPGSLTDYGVYAEPIREVLIANGLEVTYVKDGLEGIKRALDREHPVIAWVTYRLRVQHPVEITLSTGQEVKMVNYEHAVVVTGYNQEGFWVNDPFDGWEYFYTRADFERSFGYLDNMALEVAP